MQKSSGIGNGRWMYLTLSPKYKLDDDDKANVDTFEFYFHKL